MAMSCLSVGLFVCRLKRVLMAAGAYRVDHSGKFIANDFLTEIVDLNAVYIK